MELVEKYFDKLNLSNLSEVSFRNQENRNNHINELILIGNN